MFTPHYFRRSHTIYDNISVLREMARNPVFINGQDAAEKGIKDGDTVLIYNQYQIVVGKLQQIKLRFILRKEIRRVRGYVK